MDNEKQYDNPLEEQEHQEVDKFLQEVQWQDADISQNWLDPSEQYVRPRYTLSYNGVPFAPLGGIHGLTGQPGHGKTFTFTQLMVAVLKGEFYGLHYELSHDIPEPKVLYIDTEMEKGNTQLVMLRVYEMMGWPKGSQQEQFKILWLREEVKAEDRWKKTLKAIKDMQPTVVFLDGLIDVVGDFNDNKECQLIIYQCMATASHYGISLWCLLHENPGSTKMVGHAGSFLERKATDVLKTKKNKEGGVVSFEVSQSKARARDLDTWKFTIEDDENHYGHPVLEIASATTDNTKPIVMHNVEDVEQWFRNIEERIEWPASAGDIKAALKEETGETNNDSINSMLTIAKNRNFILQQKKDEWAPGQKAPKWKFNIAPF